MDIHFDCTKCGKCCHDLKLPLSIDEAIAWLEHDGDIELLCEALPWLEEPPADNLAAQNKRQRSFPATSGTLPVRVIVTVAAAFAGACPHLRSDMTCGFYPLRPRVCRIYPAEVNPFVELVPERKACPPEAWAVGNPLLMRGGKVVNDEMNRLIAESRAVDFDDAAVRGRACAGLGIAATAFVNEGFAIHAPPRAAALAALRAARDTPADEVTLPDWNFVSHRGATVEMLAAAGARSLLAAQPDGLPFEYLAFPDMPTQA